MDRRDSELPFWPDSVIIQVISGPQIHLINVEAVH
jgi:hypothetical protein